MTIKQLIDELKHFHPDQEIEICCYTAINDSKEMVIYDDNICQIRKEISCIGIETDGKTVAIS